MKDAKKYLPLLSFILCCFVSTKNLSNPICSRTGAITVCGKGTLDHLHVAGKVTLDGTTVLEKTEIAGMLNAKEVYLNTLKVSGKVSLYNSQIKGTAKISGMLDAQQSKFYQKIDISSDMTHLSASYSRDIQISRGGDRQVLCLKDNTIIDGNILFTSNRGVVVIDRSSKINGRVDGGYIKQNEFESYCEGEANND
jgi:hypothetical protein